MPAKIYHLKETNMIRSTIIAFLFCMGLALSGFSGEAQDKTRGAASASQSIHIRVRLAEEQRTDTLRLVVCHYIINDRYKDADIRTATRDASGFYSFTVVGIMDFTYISLFKDFKGKNPKYMLQYYLTEPGDDITVRMVPDTGYIVKGQLFISPYFFPTYDYANWRFIFSGKGSPKYQCRYDIDKAVVAQTPITTSIDPAGRLVPETDYSDVCERISNGLLAKNKTLIGAACVDQLRTDFFATFESERIKWINSSLYRYRDDTILLKKVLAEHERKLKDARYSFINQDRSSQYAQFVTAKALLDARLFGAAKIYEALNATYQGELRDKVLTLFAIQISLRSSNQNVVNQALQSVRTEYCQAILSRYSDANSIGKTAYPFLLTDIDGKKVRLQDLAGKVVFMDFWFNGCDACTAYYQNVLSKVEDVYKNNKKVVFLSINVDANREKWLDGIHSGTYTSSSDALNLNTNGQGTDDPLIQFYGFTGYPKMLLIGRDGKIVSNNYDDLRAKGVDGLRKAIESAIEYKPDGMTRL